MVQGLIVKWIIKAIMKAIQKKHDLKKIDAYVNKPNELDKKVKKMEKQLKELDKLSHPPQEYICCRKCGCKIAKAKRVKDKVNKLKEKFK